MGRYDLTPNDISIGIKRILTEAYATSNVCDNPELIYITAGPGAGKTSIERHIKQELTKKDIDAFIINSDKIAEFHPNYDEALEELPEECYRITRQFVRPATPRIFDELMNQRISIINENTLDHGSSDIEQAKKFKDAGYKISINVMATDLFESRLSCYEREATVLQLGLTPRGCSKETQFRMYNSFIRGVRNLQELGLVNQINVYTRGKNITQPPNLVYKTGDTRYRDFQEAINVERKKQRDKLFMRPADYYSRIKKTREIIEEYGQNPTLTSNTLQGLAELEQDFATEYSNQLYNSENER